jgi:hypothetical protein
MVDVFLAARRWKAQLPGEDLDERIDCFDILRRPMRLLGNDQDKDNRVFGAVDKPEPVGGKRPKSEIVIIIGWD